MSKNRPPRRQIFVLTSEEKRIVACVLGALVVGLSIQHYRATHPRPPLPLTAKQAQAAKAEARRTAARARSSRQKAMIAATTPSPSEDDSD